MSNDGEYLIACINGGRVYYSGNGGSTWSETQPAGAVDKSWTFLRGDSTGQHAIIGVYVGRLYLTSNYGATWSETRPVGDTNKAWAMAAISPDGNYLLAGVWVGRLYLSSNGGSSWAETQPAGNVTRDWNTAAFSTTGQYAVVAARGGRAYVTSNGGASWSEVRPAGDLNKNWIGSAISGDGSTMLLGVENGRLYRSTDYGGAWAEVQPAGNADKYWYALAADADGSHLVAANYSTGRLYISNNGGSSWPEQQPAGDVGAAWRCAAMGADSTYVAACVENTSAYGRIWLAEYWEPVPTIFIGTSSLTADGSTITVAPWYGRARWPISERLAWSTDILRGRTKSEQRICRRAIPLQFYTVPFILENAGEAAEFANLLHAWKDRQWPVPVWGEAKRHTADLAAGETSITVDTTYSSFREGALALIWQRDRAECRLISTVAAGSLTLSMGLVNAYPGDKWLLPARQGWLLGVVQRQRLPGGGSIVTMEFAVDDIAEVTGHVAAMTYDGLEVWTSPAELLRREWTESTDPQGVQLASVSGKIRIVPDADFALSTQDHGWACRTLAEVWALRQRLHAVFGRQKSFLVPTFQPDLTATRQLAAGGTSLYVRNRRYVTMGVNTLRTYLGLRPPGGNLIVRKVNAVSAVSSTEELITLNAAPGVTVPTNSLICWVDRCRLAEDEVEILWHKRGLATCETKLARIEQ